MTSGTEATQIVAKWCELRRSRNSQPTGPIAGRGGRELNRKPDRSRRQQINVEIINTFYPALMIADPEGAVTIWPAGPPTVLTKPSLLALIPAKERYTMR